MNDNAKRWVADLRSGSYKQGTGRLRSVTPEEGVAYCCLGVAIMTYNEATGAHAPLSGICLPGEVRDWLGLSESSGAYGTSFSLNDANDIRRLSFEQIADIIESEPEGLFLRSPSQRATWEQDNGFSTTIPVDTT